MSHEGACYCPNCDRSFDREGTERELGGLRSRLSAVEGERDAARKGRIIAELNEREAEARVSELEALLGRWMFWASGVAFKSTDGELIEHDTDKALAHPIKTEGDGGTPTTETKGRP